MGGRRHPVGRSPAALAAIEDARRALDGLGFYPRPVRTERVRILHTPWLFAIPGFRRFRGYELAQLIFIRMPLAQAPPGLIAHELCHVWQHQHRPLRMWLSYLRGYRDNPHEVEARAAAAAARALAQRMRKA